MIQDTIIIMCVLLIQCKPLDIVCRRHTWNFMHSRQLIVLRMDYLLCGLTLDTLALFYVIIILEQRVVPTFYT